MGKTSKLLNCRVWESFLEIRNKEDIFLDYDHYLFRLVEWMKINSDKFEKELMEQYRIDTLLELDNVLKYVGNNAEICLDKESKRVFENMPKTEEMFLMRIGNTLWDLVRKRSGKDCPRCMADELNYVLAKTEKEKKIVLECDTCGWTEYLNGEKWDGGKAKIYPVDDKDMKSVIGK